ncbi:MAG: hypothetical protein WC529_02310 [Candidatus Margulisiibacteriota bacterium]
MKKLIVSALFACLAVSAVFAMTLPTGVGAKYGAMGGAGASIVDDITCAYYNPAAIVETGRMEFKLAAGAATEGLNDIMSTFGNTSNPTKFLADNWNKTANINGGLNAFVGINVAKIGISVIPLANLTLVKPTAGTFAGSSLTAIGAYEGILTLGYSLKTPGLPIATLDLGANIKSSNLVGGFSSATGATTASGGVATLNGVGYDLGAKASINTGVMPFNFALVLRDLSTSLKGKIKPQTSTFNPVTGVVTTVDGAETDAGDTTVAPATVISASTTIPVVGLKVALDIDSIAESKLLGTTVASGSLTHIGLEYPLLGGIVALRAGQVSGKSGGADVQQTTFGAGIQMGANLNIAMMTDAKNSKNNSTMVDLGFAF